MFLIKWVSSTCKGKRIQFDLQNVLRFHFVGVLFYLVFAFARTHLRERSARP